MQRTPAVPLVFHYVRIAFKALKLHGVVVIVGDVEELPIFVVRALHVETFFLQRSAPDQAVAYLCRGAGLQLDFVGAQVLLLFQLKVLAWFSR